MSASISSVNGVLISIEPWWRAQTLPTQPFGGVKPSTTVSFTDSIVFSWPRVSSVLSSLTTITCLKRLDLINFSTKLRMCASSLRAGIKAVTSIGLQFDFQECLLFFPWWPTAWMVPRGIPAKTASKLTLIWAPQKDLGDLALATAFRFGYFYSIEFLLARIFIVEKRYFRCHRSRSTRAF